jgi:hypothetical protein
VVLSPPFFFKNIKMAINVNTVYTTVLSILNKEQRGYLTPDEFNKIATQVQLEIFEKFFEDYNQYIRMPKTDVEFASRVDHVLEEFQVFEKTENASAHASNVYTQPTDLHRFGSASWNKGKNSPLIEILSNRDYNQLKLSPLIQPTNDFPVAKYQQDKLTVFPSPTAFNNKDVDFNYIRKPKDVRWGYTVGSLGQYIYDSTSPYGLIANRDIASSITQNIIGGTGVGSPYSVTVGATAGVTTSGDGTGVTLSIVVGGGVVTNVNVDATTLGSGFKAGDTIIIPNSIIPAASQQSLVITLQQADLFTATTQHSVNFEISDSQQTEAILEILKYSGIVIRDPQIIQAASQELAQEEVNSKR